MARKSKGPIEVQPEFLDEYKAIRELLWKSGELLDAMGLAMADGYVKWPVRLRTRYERLRAAIDRKHRNWSASGTRR
jgi:hypothetical protein